MSEQSLEVFLNSEFALHQATKNAKKATITNLHLVEIKKIRLPVPPLTKQIQFASIIEAIEAQKAQLKRSLVQLETQFNALMQRAFNGELIPE